jgi:peptidyl-prolyl cis-trans isomerase A (cyclophilin A)
MLKNAIVFFATVLLCNVSSAQQQNQNPFQPNAFRPAATPYNPAQPQTGQQPMGQQTPAATGSPAGTSEVTTVVAAGDKNLFATLETSMGKIKVELFATITPRTVRNFVELANGQKDFTDVKTGRSERRPFYDGLIFHKVTKGFSIQTGCPYGTGKGGPGYIFNDEISQSLRHDKAGVVSMANTGANQNGSQFFITLAAQPELDDKYTIFGQVIEGMDVVRKIANVKVGPTDRPLKRIILKKVSISE